MPAASLLALAMRHKLVTLVIVGLLLVSIGSAASSLTLVTVDPEQDGNYNGWHGHVHLQGGIDNRGETFVTSGEPGFKSQSIVVGGHITAPSLADASLASLSKYAYHVFVNGEARKELDSPEYDPGDGIVNGLDTSAYSFQLDGRVTGAVRVELWAFVGSGIGRVIPGASYSWQKIAQDGARLVDGGGSVRLTPGQSDTFQEGDTVKIDVQTGEGHWIVTMYNGRGEPACGFTSGGFNPLTFFQSLFFVAGEAGDNPSLDKERIAERRGLEPPISSITQPTTTAPVPSSSSPSIAQLPTGSSPPTSSCKATTSWDHAKSTTLQYVVPAGAFVKGGNNVWRVALRNTLIEHATDQLVVLDKKILAPEPPTVSVNPKTPKVGRNVAFDLTARQNPTSGVAISHFLVYAWYGTSGLMPTPDSPAWIARGIPTPAVLGLNGPYTYSGSYSFVVGQADVIQYRVYTVDQDGRASGSTLAATDAAALAEAYVPPPSSPAANSTTYQAPPNTDSRGDVHPEGSKDSRAGPQPPVPDARAHQVLVLLVVLALVAALLAFVLMPGPVLLRGASVVLVLLAFALYAWFSGATQGVT